MSTPEITALPATEPTGLPGLPPIDVNEYGGKKDGQRQVLNRRLFMQLLVFDVPTDESPEHVAQATGEILRGQQIASVLYADTSSPRGLGLLTWSESPDHFVTHVRPLFAKDPLRSVEIRRDFSMLGRTYSTGHEPDLEFVLLRRPIANVLQPESPWHIWYPLRRLGTYAQVEPKDQSHIMREHAAIGFAYGKQELAHDVRLACHGLDSSDNDFVIGLVGHALHPLSHLVQTMRKTKQTSEFIAHMGPFFVGHVLQRVGT